MRGVDGGDIFLYHFILDVVSLSETSTKGGRRMSTKILIERKFKEPVTPDVLRIIEDIRIKALRQRGYIGGETVINKDNHHELMVISLWSNVQDWQTWYDGKDWKELEKELAPLLAEPVTVRVFIPSTDYEAMKS
jgi:heme-degrading monooxygenase HmoA